RSRTLLELDHRNARALGGTDDAANLALKCRRHNGLDAERVFGRQYVERKKKEKKSHPLQRSSAGTIRRWRSAPFAAWGSRTQRYAVRSRSSRSAGAVRSRPSRPCSGTRFWSWREKRRLEERAHGAALVLTSSKYVELQAP